MVNILDATNLSGKLEGEVVLLPQLPMILSDSPTHSNVCNFQFAQHLLWPLKGTTSQRGLLHPPQCTTSREDREIERRAITDRSVTSRTIAQHIGSVKHHLVSARTIRRHLQ
ncbi:hypothetical protein TNCV_3237401 [Trichonephila clavipes]|nr:hypothetical protein TNCV_3237401 [Trichonephila clavipes]